MRRQALSWQSIAVRLEKAMLDTITNALGKESSFCPGQAVSPSAAAVMPLSNDKVRHASDVRLNGHAPEISNQAARGKCRVKAAVFISQVHAPVKMAHLVHSS